MAGGGRGLTAGGVGDSISSASGSSSPPRVGTPGISAMTPERTRSRGGLKSRGIGGWGGSVGKGRVRPRECGSKVGIVRRTTRKYYGTWLGKRTRRKGKVGRSVIRISSRSKKNRSESLRRHGNRKSGWDRSRKVVNNRTVTGRIVTGGIASGNRQGRDSFWGVRDRVDGRRWKGSGRV